MGNRHESVSHELAAYSWRLLILFCSLTSFFAFVVGLCVVSIDQHFRISAFFRIGFYSRHFWRARARADFSSEKGALSTLRKNKTNDAKLHLHKELMIH